MDLQRRADALVITVTNSAGKAEADGTGSRLGLVGMAERVSGVGGTLETGPTPDGGFRVVAVLPVRAEGRDGTR